MPGTIAISKVISRHILTLVPYGLMNRVTGLHEFIPSNLFPDTWVHSDKFTEAHSDLLEAMWYYHSDERRMLDIHLAGKASIYHNTHGLLYCITTLKYVEWVKLSLSMRHSNKFRRLILLLRKLHTVLRTYISARSTPLWSQSSSPSSEQNSIPLAPSLKELAGALCQQCVLAEKIT